MNVEKSSNRTIVFHMFSLVIVLFTFFFMEIFYRFYFAKQWHDPISVYDKKLGWINLKSETLKNQNGVVKTNKYGFRSKELLDNRDKDIIILGDSVAHGLGIDQTDSLAYVIERSIKNNKIQLHNLAVSGYSPVQSYLSLKGVEHLFKKKSRVLLFLHPFNDFDEVARTRLYFVSKPLFHVQENNLIEKTPNKNRYHIQNILGRSEIIKRVLRDSFLRSIMFDEDYLSEEEVESNIKFVLARLNEEYDLKIILTTHLYFYEDHIKYEKMKKILRELNLSYLDMYELWKPKENHNQIEHFYIDPWHLSREGTLELVKAIPEKWLN